MKVLGQELADLMALGQDLKGDTHLMDLEDQDQVLKDLIGHLVDLDLKIEIMGLAQVKGLNLLIDQEYFLE